MSVREVVQKHQQGLLTSDEAMQKINEVLESAAKKTLHLRLAGVNVKLGERPTSFVIGIEEGGTYTNPGDVIWTATVSTESAKETVTQMLAELLN